MSGSTTPVADAGRREKTMSSRLLTMKFMQRGAASATSARNQNGQDDYGTKRQKLSPSLPSSPVPYASTPTSLYRSDESSTPQSQARTTAAAPPPVYWGNAAETPWVLNVAPNMPVGTGAVAAAAAARRSPSPPETPEVVGRRNFGDFRKKEKGSGGEEAGRAVDSEDQDGSLSSADVDDGVTEAWNYRRAALDTQRNGNREREKRVGKRRQVADDNDDRMDRINLKKLKNSGISASATRRPALSASKGEMYKNDRRGGRHFA